MSFIDDFLAQQRDDRDEQIKADLYQTHYIDGANDAAFGVLPQYKNEFYLNGYLSKLQELPTTPDGKIQHYSPHQHFAWGYLDSPDPGPGDEF